MNTGGSITDTPNLGAYVRHLTGLDLAQRGRILARLVADGRALARQGLRHRHPAAAPLEIEIRLAALLYGRAAASRLGPVPPDAVEAADVP